MRILIAEDDVTSRNILSAVLEKSGHEVVETENGRMALETYKKSEALDMAILDWMMPEMDGVETVRQIRRLVAQPPTYIIMLTTRTEKADIVHALEAGADDYLVKPFDVGELLARIDVGRRIVDLQRKLLTQVRELREAAEHIKILQGILPICGYCKKIRNDKGYWDRVETYISRHTDAKFSHGICPECLKIHYPKYSKKEND